jgi:hypothetical protein
LPGQWNTPHKPFLQGGVAQVESKYEAPISHLSTVNKDKNKTTFPAGRGSCITHTEWIKLVTTITQALISRVRRWISQEAYVISIEIRTGQITTLFPVYFVFKNKNIIGLYYL